MSDIFQVNRRQPEPPVIGGRVKARPPSGLEQFGQSLTGIAKTIASISSDVMRREEAEYKQKEAERKRREGELKNMTINNELAAAINNYNQAYDDWERGLIDNDDYTSYVPEYDQRKVDFYDNASQMHIKDPDALMLFQKWYSQQDSKRRDAIGDLAQKRQISQNLVNFHTNFVDAVKAKDSEMANDLITSVSKYLDPDQVIEYREAAKEEIAFNTLYDQAKALAFEAVEDPTILTAEAKRQIFNYVMTTKDSDLSLAGRNRLVQQLEAELAKLQTIKTEEWNQKNDGVYKQIVRDFGTPEMSRAYLEENAEWLTGTEYQRFDGLFKDHEAYMRTEEAKEQIRQIELEFIDLDYRRELDDAAIRKYAHILPQDVVDKWARRLEENEEQDRRFLAEIEKQAKEKINSEAFYAAWVDLITGKTKEPWQYWDRELYPHLENDDRKELEKELQRRIEKAEAERKELEKQAKAENPYLITDPNTEAEVISAFYSDMDMADFRDFVKERHGRGLSNDDTTSWLGKKRTEDPIIQGAVDSIEDYWDTKIKAEKDPKKRQALQIEKGKALKRIQTEVDSGEYTPQGITEIADSMIYKSKMNAAQRFLHNTLDALAPAIFASAAEIEEAERRRREAEGPPEVQAERKPEKLTFERWSGATDFETDVLDDGTETYIWQGQRYAIVGNTVFIYDSERGGFRPYGGQEEF